MKKTITVSKELIEEKAIKGEKIYLGDLDEFKGNNVAPLYNTIFNKRVTGIGGTSLALNSSENIIILMPFVEVVDNKADFNEDTFIIRDGVTIKKIVKYIKDSNIIKIVSTYDGLSKIKEAFDICGLNMYDIFLLVDEWQVVFQQYGLRHKVMKNLLNESMNFKNKCFMTATPIKKDYWFDELGNLDELNLIYDIQPTMLRHFNCKSIIDEAIAIINSRNTNNNLHFFINSIDTIKEILCFLKVDKDDIRIVCAKNEKNREKLGRYKIGSTKNKTGIINFYTSTCFEGCDIYDEDGLIYVLCDGSKAHSLVDISTTLPQIAGRIRDVKDGTVNLIYSSSRYIGITEEEFEKSTVDNIRSAEIVLGDAKNKETIDMLDRVRANDKYLIVEDDKLFFEKVLLNVDRANFELSKTYSLKANLIAKSSNIFNSVEVVKPWADQLNKDKIDKIDKLSFKEQCLLYSSISNGLTVCLYDFDESVKKAVDILGINRLEELNFHKSNIKRCLISKMDMSNVSKVARCLKLQTGEFIKSSELISKFRDIYRDLGIDKKAKATDILNYYDVRDNKEISKRIDGNKVKGYLIIRSKVVFKN